VVSSRCRKLFESARCRVVECEIFFPTMGSYAPLRSNNVNQPGILLHRDICICAPTAWLCAAAMYSRHWWETTNPCGSFSVLIRTEAITLLYKWYHILRLESLSADSMPVRNSRHSFHLCRRHSSVGYTHAYDSTSRLKRIQFQLLWMRRSVPSGAQNLATRPSPIQYSVSWVCHVPYSTYIHIYILNDW